MVTSITLIRHASSEPLSSNGSIKSDAHITSTGKSQAQKTALFLKGVKFSKIYTSSLARAIETAEIISSDNKTRSEDLDEFNKIIFEEQPEDVEKFNDNMLRALKTKAFFENILRTHRDSKVLIVAHGNVIRYLICSALKLKHQKAPNLFIDNASITNLFFDGNDLVSVGCINSTAHLFLNE